MKKYLHLLIKEVHIWNVTRWHWEHVFLDINVLQGSFNRDS